MRKVQPYFRECTPCTINHTSRRGLYYDNRSYCYDIQSLSMENVYLGWAVDCIKVPHVMKIGTI